VGGARRGAVRWAAAPLVTGWRWTQDEPEPLRRAGREGRGWGADGGAGQDLRGRGTGAARRGSGPAPGCPSAAPAARSRAGRARARRGPGGPGVRVCGPCGGPLVESGLPAAAGRGRIRMLAGRDAGASGPSAVLRSGEAAGSADGLDLAAAARPCAERSHAGARHDEAAAYSALMLGCRRSCFKAVGNGATKGWARGGLHRFRV
jgi:hypothetical protein